MKEDILKDWSMAPVLIPTLCRYEHLKACIDSLAKCDLAEETDLHVSLDYPLKESHWDGYRKILSYLESVTGFKNVFIYKQEKNLGAVENWNFLHEKVKDKYKTYIGSEDDNVFSPNFLRYINEGLKRLEKDEKVFAICGYCFPIEAIKDMNTYFLYPAFSAWGYGTWIGKESAFIKELYRVEYPQSVLSSFEKVSKMIKESTATFDNLVSMAAYGLLHGDTLYETKIITEGYSCLFPTLSKVRNNGHDGTGVHCGNSGQEIFEKQRIDDSKELILELAEKEELEKCKTAFKDYKCGKKKVKYKVWLKYIIYKLNLRFILKNSQKIKSIFR